MTAKLHVKTHAWRTEFKLCLSWDDGGFEGSLAIPFCRLALWIYHDDASAPLSVP